MKMTLDSTDSLNTISAYEPGRCKIQGVWHTTSLVVLPNQIINDWPVPAVDQLTQQDLAPIIEANPAVLLLGTGEQQRFPDPRHLRPLVDAQIGYEVMHNRAACQTYNILLGEGRMVAMVLLTGR